MYLLDQGLPRSTIEHLQEFGIDSAHVGNLGMAAASDEEILNEARMQGAGVVTLDADFHALLALTRASEPSVIRMRIEGMKGKQVASVIQRVESVAMADLKAGAAVTVTERRIALRRLPLNASTNS